ncbi:hypothetical protein J6590_046095 [Homalodisca vitripennis]|nr:hypothetical protein J6590_046095 [Homalodisca vitripennis]
MGVFYPHHHPYCHATDLVYEMQNFRLNVVVEYVKSTKMCEDIKLVTPPSGVNPSVNCHLLPATEVPSRTGYIGDNQLRVCSGYCTISGKPTFTICCRGRGDFSDNGMNHIPQECRQEAPWLQNLAKPVPRHMVWRTPTLTLIDDQEIL